MANYSKLGYGNLADLPAAIESGKIDGKDIVITKDTSELIYIDDDKNPQHIRMRTLVFDSIEEAKEQLAKNSDTYAGQTIMIRDENGKYQPYTVQTADEGFVVEPFATTATGLVWQEF